MYPRAKIFPDRIARSYQWFLRTAGTLLDLKQNVQIALPVFILFPLHDVEKMSRLQDRY